MKEKIVSGLLFFSCILTFGAVLIAPFKAFAQADVEAMVRTYFADAPVMIRVAQCESKFRQFTDSGAVLRGGYQSKMVGVFQFYGDIHSAAALAMGDDINTLLGNLEYARYVYNHQGTDPWMDSFSCWNDSTSEGTTTPALPVAPSATTTPATVSTTTASTMPQTVPPATSGSNTLTVNLSFGLTHPEVVVLQQMLNTKGFTIASEGPGSPGQETTKFGNYTREAVRKFQCAAIAICSGDEYSTGYGFVGPKTRGALVTMNGVPAPSPVASTPSPSPVAPTAPSSPAATSASTPTPPTSGTGERGVAIEQLRNQIAQLQKQLDALLASAQ